ncbi:LAETG motif-containing sortase-dependent surface protein [Streptomyces sp. NPDC050504]|uniref:LAETG motif-containing sortase-dependent surface protein n=1 Tax=Streptomyces sp. NPDC050504 TaxID=3365618 RepID=UPI0037B75D89
MNLRRTLATAVATAVTAPVLLVAAAPAFADAPPVSTRQLMKDRAEDHTDERPDRITDAELKRLEKAAAEAKKKYDDAVAAKKAAVQGLKDGSAFPEQTAAYAAAKTAATEAATKKDEADKAVTDAEKKLAELPDTATPEETEAAQKAVTDAKAAAKTAADTKTAADAKRELARLDVIEAEVRQSRKIGELQIAVEEALAAKTEAEKAYADAKEAAEEQEQEEDCPDVPGFSTVVTGMPEKITAGTTVDLKLRVANDSAVQQMDEVLPLVSVFGTGSDESDESDALDEFLDLKWSATGSSDWKSIRGGDFLDVLGPLKKGEHIDIKLRLEVDKKAPAGEGLLMADGMFFNDSDASCGYTAELDEHEFQVKAVGAGKPAEKPKSGTSSVTAQGNTSQQPVGTLANTGSNSATPKIALAGGAAVVLGAGAVLVARRRKGSDAA